MVSAQLEGLLGLPYAPADEGQALVLAGRLEEALPRLTGLWRCAALLSLGRLEEARRELPSAGEGEAFLRAVLAAREGDLGPARRLAAPGEVWPHLLRAAVEPEPSAQRDALLAAAKLRDSAAIHDRLSAVYERLGILPEAISHAARALARERTVERHAAKAELHVRWREPELAVAEYTKALELAPGDPQLHYSRSKAWSTAGKPLEGLEDARLSGRADWHCQLLLLAGKRPPLRLLPPALRLWVEAYGELLAGRRARAARLLERCERRAEGALKRKASFYRTVASVSGTHPRSDVLLIGLGVNPPYSATLDCLRAVAACDVVFNNVMGDEMFELLRLFCRDVRPIAYHQDNDEDELCRRMLAEARPGRAVGFVTRGSAIVYGPLGTELLRRCRAEGLSAFSLAAVSSAELLGAKFPGRGRQKGQVALDSDAAEALGRPGAPATIYLNMDSEKVPYPRVCRALAGLPEVLVLDHVIGQEPLRKRGSELEALESALSPSAIFHVP